MGSALLLLTLGVLAAALANNARASVLVPDYQENLGELTQDETLNQFTLNWGHVDGSDCPGEFGASFDECLVDGSPSIIKFDFEFKDAQVGVDVNELFQTTLGGTGQFDDDFDDTKADPFTASTDEYQITFDEFKDETSGDPEAIGGTWSYTLEEGDPVVRYWASQSTDGFNLYWLTEQVDDVIVVAAVPEGKEIPWQSPGVLKGNGKKNGNNGPKYKEISHLTFYDTGQDLPEPSSLLLVGAGLLGLGLYRRTRRKARQQR